ncbi:hypothetical protein CALCODRAFT_495908 [Calocera cornea HHB12733]|uniref:Uncharacterized protein n=1 Tax=Calocera cornea HHB12733 TaxID=1353952 RepID=A0A165G6S5_9BASI|nr:hypothetical protein CALCODRAFT_495908 [Calocera cornea HHB12733]
MLTLCRVARRAPGVGAPPAPRALPPARYPPSLAHTFSLHTTTAAAITPVTAPLMPVAVDIALPAPQPRKKRRAGKRTARPLPVWALTPSIPRSPTTSTPELEALIAHLLLLRYEQDIARLFSVHVDNVARKYLPKIMERMTLTAGSPGWCAVHAGDEAVKDFLRGVVAMDLRQAGERVAPRSLEWSYTSLRHFVSPASVDGARAMG